MPKESKRIRMSGGDDMSDLGPNQSDAGRDNSRDKNRGLGGVAETKSFGQFHRYASRPIEIFSLQSNDQTLATIQVFNGALASGQTKSGATDQVEIRAEQNNRRASELTEKPSANIETI
jgi:hypothetical protein